MSRLYIDRPTGLKAPIGREVDIDRCILPGLIDDLTGHGRFKAQKTVICFAVAVQNFTIPPKLVILCPGFSL
jgi:hypothetical protein